MQQNQIWEIKIANVVLLLMKIIQVTPVYPPYAGGIGSIAHEYTERLRARGFDVHVTTPAYKNGRESDDPEYVHRIAPVIEWGNAAFVPRLHKILSGYDVIHLHYPFFGGAEVVVFDQIVSHKIPLVVTYHHDVVAKGMKAAFFAAHRRALMPTIMKRADRILVNSTDYAEHSDIRLLLDDKRVVELPFGVDLERFHPGFSPDVRAKHNIPNTSPVIIFVGGLDSAHYFKGISVLLDALEKIADAQWHALIVGDGDMRESYEMMARVTAVASRIHFAGKVLWKDLPGYYRAANIHVLPSTDKSEAFGIVNLEAAASGLPSVVSDLPGVRTTVLDGQTGFHVPVRDAVALAKSLRDLLENHTAAERMGEQARLRVELEYNWPLIIDRLVGVYRDVTV